MDYQDRILEVGSDIFQCPNLRSDKGCQSELTDVTNSEYKHGPEICFVGSRYSEDKLPRILFTRLNPTWNDDVGWFGTRESVETYKQYNPTHSVNDIFERYLKGWEIGKRRFRGLWDAGTVTGHDNREKIDGAMKRSEPTYGIQVIMEEMVREGVYPRLGDSPLEYCAINNLVKCSGSLDKWNPGTNMIDNCRFWIFEVEILAPHIVVAFGRKTSIYLRRKISVVIRPDGLKTFYLPSGRMGLFFEFPHPLPPGRWTWQAKGVEHLCREHKLARTFGINEARRFAVGPLAQRQRISELLFKYTMRLVFETKRLKNGSHLSPQGCTP